MVVAARVDRSDQPVGQGPNTNRRPVRRALRAAQIIVSVAIVIGVFAGILPKIADYSAVWVSIGSLTWFELGTLVAVTACSGLASWGQMVASLPGLTVAQAAVTNQASTTIANTLPGGGVIAVGVSYAMYRSWGFKDSAIALSNLITFAWNTFVRLLMPVIALGILVLGGKGGSGLIVASLVALAVLALAIAVFALVQWKKALAGQIGSVLGAVASFLRKLIRMPPVGDWGEVATRFRGEASRLVAVRWAPLTVATVAGHLVLYLALVLALRDVGVSAREVSWAQVLGVFALVRLRSALPITPGGLGIVELGLHRGVGSGRPASNGRARSRVPGPGRRRGAGVSSPHLWAADPHWSARLPHLAAQEELAQSCTARIACGGRRRPRGDGVRFQDEIAAAATRKGSPPEVSSPLGPAGGRSQTVAGTPWKNARSPTELVFSSMRSARFSLTQEAATGVAAWAWSRVSQRLIDRHCLSPRSATP
jgi:uncharacterized membrane protein YbhN (UPF0104 family)